MSSSRDIHLNGNEFVAIILDRDLHFSLLLDKWAFWAAVALGIAPIVIRFARPYVNVRFWRTFEIDQAQFGLGQQTITLRPNEMDRQIAYKIWVELSTRKIGLPINLDDDVIVEIYDSWYNFFSVTRELIKDVPVSKFRRRDTEQFIRLSIDVLNTGLRPHLTKWQARFRRWYEQALKDGESLSLHPQDIQKRFPEYQELRADLVVVNQRLIMYREKMYELVTNL